MEFIRSRLRQGWFRLLVCMTTGVLALDLFWFTQLPSAKFWSEDEATLLTTEARLISFFGGAAGFLLYWRVKGSFTMVDQFSSHTEND